MEEEQNNMHATNDRRMFEWSRDWKSIVIVKDTMETLEIQAYGEIRLRRRVFIDDEPVAWRTLKIAAVYIPGLPANVFSLPRWLEKTGDRILRLNNGSTEIWRGNDMLAGFSMFQGLCRLMHGRRVDPKWTDLGSLDARTKLDFHWPLPLKKHWEERKGRPVEEDELC
jgi:hypothetical protein